MYFSPTEALAALSKDGVEAFQASRYIRNRADRRDQIVILNSLPVGQPRVQELLTGICFANNWKEVWAYRLPATISNSQKAIQWLILLIERHVSKIKQHVSLRSTLVPSMLHGRWELAKAKFIEKRLKDSGSLPQSFKVDVAFVTSSPLVELQEVLKLSDFIGEYNQDDMLHYYLRRR